MRRRVVACLFAVGLVVLAAAAPEAQAPRDLSVSPPYGQISTDAGRMGQADINVVNLSDEEISVIASISPLEVDADGTFRATASDLASAVPWGAVEPSSFTLPAGTTRIVRATFTPPPGTPAGGYYSAVRLAGTIGSSGSVEAVHPVLMEVAGDGILTRRGRLVSVDVPAASVRTSIPVTLTIENTGNVHVIAKGRLSILDPFSRETATLPITQAPILPGRTRTVVVDVPAPIVPGPVTVRASMTFGRGSSEVTQSSSGYSLPWWGIAAFLVVLFLVARLVLAIVRRRRRRRAARQATRGEALPAEIALERAPLEEAAGLPAPAPADSWSDAWEIEPVPRAAEPEEELLPEVHEEELVPKEPVEVEASSPFAPAAAAEEEAALVEEPAEEAASEDAVLDLSAVLAFEDEAIEEEPEAEPIEEPVEPEPVEEEPVWEEPEIEPEPLPVPPSVFRELESLPPPPEPGPEPELEPEPEPEPEPVRQPVARAATRAFPRGAALRRVRVALDMLADGGDETKLDVGLEMLETLREQEEVRAAVEEAYAVRRGPTLGLALDAVGSERAPAALIEAFGAAKGTLSERLRVALGTYPAERLRSETDAIASIPKKRREELGLR